MATKSKPRLLLVLTAMCLLHAAETSLQIIANPPDINMIDVKPLTIKCMYIHDTINATNKLSLHSITISKRGQVLGTFDILSELTLSNPYSPASKNTQQFGITSSSGHIVKNMGTSFLSVTWGVPSPKETGTFACTAHTVDSLGVPSTEIHEAQIRDDSILVLGQKLKSLQNQVLQQELCCHAATARIAEFEVWRKTISTSMTFFADHLAFLHSAEYNNRTYIVSNYTVNDINIAEAVCQTMGGYLAEIDDAQEWAFILGVLKKTHFANFYIGGKDDVVEGYWYWTHSRRPLTFAPWNTGEPNNSGGEDCLEIINTSATLFHYALNDISCAVIKRNTFVCEIPNN